MPIVMLQFFSYLYQSNFNFQTICLSPEFLTGLIDLLVISKFCQTAQAKGGQQVSLHFISLLDMDNAFRADLFVLKYRLRRMVPANSPGVAWTSCC